MAYGKCPWPAYGLAGFSRLRRANCKGALRGVHVVEPDCLADHCDRLKGFQPGVAVEGRWIRTEGPLREADHDPSRRRLIPIQIAVRRKSMARQIHVTVQRRKDDFAGKQAG